jgi:hypothetical protein
VFGMLGQPFWFYAWWKIKQWGIFAVSVLYALAWMKGLWVLWISPKPEGVSTIQLPPDSRRI